MVKAGLVPPPGPLVPSARGRVIQDRLCCAAVRSRPQPQHLTTTQACPVMSPVRGGSAISSSARKPLWGYTMALEALPGRRLSVLFTLEVYAHT